LERNRTETSREFPVRNLPRCVGIQTRRRGRDSKRFCIDFHSRTCSGPANAL